MVMVGAACGLLAAMSWAVASVFYTRVPIGAGPMTTIKNSLAAVILFVVLVVWKVSRGKPVFEADLQSFLWLSWSGIIGLALCDIAYFRSIQILGARRGLTLTLLNVPTTACVGFIILGEALSIPQWLAILTTLAGIAYVMRERTSRTAEQEIRPGSESWGVICSGLAILGTAYASVIMKRASTGNDALESAFIRLLSAGCFGTVLSVTLREQAEIVDLLKNRLAMRYLAFATLVGTVLGAWLMLVCFKYSASGVAATLTSTTPLFVIPVVYFLLGHSVSVRSCFGAVLAFIGVAAIIQLS